MTTQSHKHDGGIERTRILNLDVKQLRKLAEEMELTIPRGFQKQQIREQIISFSISNSSDWKLWAKATKYLGDKYPSPTEEFKRHSSPPKAGRDFELPDKYRERGVRVMKVREAYPEDRSALSDQTTSGLENFNSIDPKRSEDHLNRSIRTEPLALSPIEDFSNPLDNAKVSGFNRRNAIVNKVQMSWMGKLITKFNITTKVRVNGIDNPVR